jgi:hypothetical protein
MQTLRLLPAVAAIALCASTFSTRADDTPAQAAARAALMQDMNETGNTETPTPPPASVPPPAPAQLPPPETIQTNMQVATPAPAATVPATASGSSTNLVVPPVEQVTVPTNQLSQYPVNPAPANPGTNPMMVLTNAPSPGPGITPSPAADQPVTAPPLPISEGQQQQLQALLQQYVANQISPAQYQVERAKILAGQ